MSGFRISMFILLHSSIYSGILSRFPIEYSTNYLMPLVNPANEQRGLLCNKISFGTTKLNLFSIHYPTNFEERKLATEELINIIEKIDDSIQNILNERGYNE